MARPSCVDPDYWALLGGKTPTPAPPATDLLANRASINAASQAASNALPLPDGMTTTVSTVTSADGSTFIVTRFVPRIIQQRNETAQGAVIYGFGGGLIAGGVKMTFNMIANFAERTATQIFAPDYRLAPEHPHPTALQDINSTITWLQARAGEFSVDPARIVMFGQSAGGNLVASVALKARDEGLNLPIAALVLRYPMLDDRTQMDPGDLRFPYLTWGPSNNAIAWNAYLGKDSNAESILNTPLVVLSKPKSCINISQKARIPYTAVPARAEDLHKLPPTHLAVGGLDLFCDGTISFATRLASQDVRVQLNVYPGVPHGFDGSPAFSLGTQRWSDEARFIQKF
ncbi:hypothetical protein KJ359_011451 [Pestalotiopsis sp. 9143b]|nr:hypothetical protein KJ359_011451 [Pestalotiopsis sp. 9143b]